MMKYKIAILAVGLIYMVYLVPVTLSLPLYKWHTLQDHGSLYIDPGQKYNWLQAMSECAQRNMTLLTINDPKKNDDIKDLLRANFNKTAYFWIGGHNNGNGKQFVWTSTGKHLEFTNWLKGRPDNTDTSVHCITITELNEWDDFICNTNQLGMICEQNTLVSATQNEWEVKKRVIQDLLKL